MQRFKKKKNFFITEKNHKQINVLISPELFKNVSKEALDDLISIADIPQTLSPILAMPDIHIGYSVPIGSVFSCLKSNAVISSEAVGYDINCGIRLIKTNLFKKDVSSEQLKVLAKELKKLPLGLSSKGIKITKQDLEDVLNFGSRWALSHKYCKKKDLQKIYSQGFFEGADPSKVSEHAKKRGINQLGTLGKGNHFIDVLEVSKIFNKDLSDTLNLRKGELVVMIHTGSRGLGHQVTTDYNKLFENKKPFSHTHFDSKTGKNCFKAMLCASNFAFVNRIVLSFLVNQAFNKVFKKDIEFSLVYDLSHNLASLENINGKELLVTRKGATRVFTASQLPSTSPFKKTGSPIILPGSMLAESYVLFPGKNINETLYSVAHGSGRALSRTQVKQKFSFKDLKNLMQENNIVFEALSENHAREEHPFAYKTSKHVVKVMQDAGVVEKALKLKPVLVLIG